MNLYESLNVFQNVERDFLALWQKATSLARLGGLTAEQRVNLHRLRDSMHEQQWWIVGRVKYALRNIPGASARIPSPAKLPDLPPAGGAVRGVVVRGLGAVPVVFAVAAVILAALAVIAGAVAMVQMYQISSAQVTELSGMRATVAENRRRFEECRAEGTAAVDCSRAIPVPVFQPRETAGGGIPGWAWAIMGVGGAALLLTGLYIYGRSTSPRIERGIYSLPERVQ